MGKTLRSATRAITKAHCKTGKVTKAYSTKVKAGVVMAERPKPRTRLKGGAKVNLTVSRGRKPKPKH